MSRGMEQHSAEAGLSAKAVEKGYVVPEVGLAVQGDPTTARSNGRRFSYLAACQTPPTPSPLASPAFLSST